jgi:hypothetical protein
LNEQIRRASRLIAVVQLQNVRLVESLVSTAIRAEEIAQGMSPQVHTTATATAEPGSGRLFVHATVDARVLGEIAKRVVRVKARFELEYSIPEELHPDRRELRAFADVNGTYNAWPYFREYVQEAFQRMQLPALVLPVFRLSRAEKSSQPR